MSKRRFRARQRSEKTAAERKIRRQSRLEPQFLDDLQYWISVSPRTAGRILELVRLTLRDPFARKGKPEALTGEEGTWSRRINEEDRLTYRVTDEHVDFLQARYHYEK